MIDLKTNGGGALNSNALCNGEYNFGHIKISLCLFTSFLSRLKSVADNLFFGYAVIDTASAKQINLRNYVMTKITHEFVIGDYEKLKNNSKKALHNNQYNDAYAFAETAAKIAYHLQFLYTDDDIEDILVRIANLTLQKREFFPRKERFVFYDFFGIDNRGLTQQYIRALKMWDVDFLYIFESTEKNGEIGKDILKELVDCKRAEIYIAPKDMDLVSKSRVILERIQIYMPEKAFLHFAPWSVLSISIWNALPSVTRYLVDLTDHAFWLGKSCSDYFIEFRDYGCTISTNFRGIDPKRLLMQKFYPIVSYRPFQGFPESTKDKTIIFCGGNYYKIYGRNAAFFNIVKKIITENLNCVILFAGNGDDKPFKRFIEKNNIGNRVVLIGDRKDINEVVRHCDIFMSTFPFGSGLLVQYALLNKKPVIGYTTRDLTMSTVNDICKSNVSVKFTYNDLNEFHNEVNLLINDIDYRVKLIQNYSNILHTPEEFSSELRDVINYNKQCTYSEVLIDRQAVEQLYLSLENNYLHKYDLIKLGQLGLKYFQYDFIGATLSMFKLLHYNKRIMVDWIIKKMSEQ